MIGTRDAFGLRTKIVGVVSRAANAYPRSFTAGKIAPTNSALTFHRDFVIGVATYAHELFSAFDDLDNVYVPIGLGSGAIRDRAPPQFLLLPPSRRRSRGHAQSAWREQAKTRPHSRPGFFAVRLALLRRLKLVVRVLLAERVGEMLGTRCWPRLALIVDEHVSGVD